MLVDTAEVNKNTDSNTDAPSVSLNEVEYSELPSKVTSGNSGDIDQVVKD
jgi:hypothetical protein